MKKQNMTHTNFLLYLKSLVWSVFVSYTEETVMQIAESLKEGDLQDVPAYQNTHLGKCVQYFIEILPQAEDRIRLAESLQMVKQSEASFVYRNMVIEVGHYVTADQTIDEIPEDCPGVTYRIHGKKIDVLFCLPNNSLVAKRVHPFQVMPVYTLTIPESPS